MNIEIKISRNGEFGLIVESLEPEIAYRDIEDAPTYGDYSWGHSATIDCLSYVDSEGEEHFVEYKVNDHFSECCLETVAFELKKDGLIKLTRLVMPNESWMEEMDGDVNFHKYTPYYFHNGEFWKRAVKDDNGNYGAIIVEDFQTIYKDDSLDNGFNTVFKTETFVFTTSYLDRCYNLLIEDLLKCVRRAGECPDAEVLARERNRDIINMFITSMKYAREMDRFFEAQRLMEQLDNCNMICNSAKITPFIRPRDCGC